VVVALCTLLLAVVMAHATADASRIRRLRIDDPVPLYKPIIVNNLGGTPDPNHAVQQIAKILEEEPLAANTAIIPDEDDEAPVQQPPQPMAVLGDVTQDDLNAEIAIENAQALGQTPPPRFASTGSGANGGDGKPHRRGGHGGHRGGDDDEDDDSGSGDGDEDDDDDEQKIEIMKEISMLERLIAEGRKIQNALPEKQARLADLKRQLMSAAMGASKAAAKKQLMAQLKLLDEINDKIDVLTTKLKQLSDRRTNVQAVIAKLKADANMTNMPGVDPGAAATAPMAPPAGAMAPATAL